MGSAVVSSREGGWELDVVDMVVVKRSEDGGFHVLCSVVLYINYRRGILW